MQVLRNFIFFLVAIILHLYLLCLFAKSFYILYFLNLLICSYLLHKYYTYFSFFIFFLCLCLVLIFISLDIYDEYSFEIFLWLDMLNMSIYINSEVMYALITLHILLLINLKKFESFWAIIGKKLFRN